MGQDLEWYQAAVAAQIGKLLSLQFYYFINFPTSLFWLIRW
jgi:hypothetical protein